MNVFICKECGNEDDYNTDHRCNKCGGIVILLIEERVLREEGIITGDEMRQHLYRRLRNDRSDS